MEVRKTICSICNPRSHCGIDAHVEHGRVVMVEGSKDNPHSAGTLCAKGAASRQYIYHPDRLKTPLLRKGERGSGDFEPISWDQALDLICERLLAIKAESGPEAAAFFAGYPKWFRPFLKRLCLSFGSPNYLTESSTCASAVQMAWRLNYGAPAQPDLARAACLLVWSSNPFYSNSSGVRRLVDAVERGLKVIEVGPMVTPLTKHAALHLRLRPGTSGALALGMANHIISQGLHDKEFVQAYGHGFDEYREYAAEFNLERAAAITGVPAETIARAAELYAGAKPAALLSGANPTVHHTNGLQNHRAIVSLVGLTGNFDRPGGNQVIPPGYLYVGNGVPVRQYAFEQSRPWSELPPRLGQEAFPVWSRMMGEGQAMHLARQIEGGKPYPIRALVGFGLNHRMWPGSDDLARALGKLDLLVDVDLFMTDTARLADLVLPACSSFERSELKFYPQQFVIYTQPAIAPLHQSRPDYEIIFDLARRLAPEDDLMQKGYEACLDWILEPGGLTVAELKRHPAGLHVEGTQPAGYEKYRDNGLATPSGKVEFASSILAEEGCDALPVYQEPALSPLSAPDTARDYPLILTTGARQPMFIHGRTFRLPWLHALRPEPLVDINPSDAAARGIGQHDLVSLSTPRGALAVRANLTLCVPSGVVSMLHSNPQADVNQLIDPDYLDPISGFPGFKSLLCQVTPITDQAEERGAA